MLEPLPEIAVKQIVDPRGNRLSAASVWRVVVDIGQAVGVRTWPNAVRHSSVTTVVDKTPDIRLGRIQSPQTSQCCRNCYLWPGLTAYGNIEPHGRT